MNFDLSDEQKMLAEQVRGLLAERAPYDHLRTLIDKDAEWDQSLWTELGAMGFLGAAIPEEYGGLGMAALDQGVISQEFGRANAAVPFFSSIILCADAIRLAGSEAQKALWLPKLQNRNAQKEYYLTDVIALAVKDRLPVVGVKADDASETEGVNSRVQLARLERVYQQRLAAQLLEAGVTLIDPQRFDQRGTLQCGRDVQIDVNCIFEGAVSLADGVSIGANCVIKDVAIGAGTRIEPFCHLDGAQIGTGCRIGPYARIRPGSQLAAEVHIGNFVEIKASDIGDGSKANHLSYVGDSTVGRNVNIGAGTITCNYDGANKHRTVIEDDVHIGSDVQLVAPVRIARGVTVGAGTTVWKDSPAGGLIINPKSQEHRAGWQRPRKATKAKK